MKTRFEKRRARGSEYSGDRTHRFHTSHAGSRTILLISGDRRLHESLRSLANEAGLMVVKTDRAVGTAEVLRAVKPDTVVLDLDLPQEAAWKTADILFNEPDCPAVILLTARTGHFAMQSAIRAGLLVSKSDFPDRLLSLIEEALEMPGSNQAERNVVRRELIRWLSPPAWTADSRSSYRFWGINE